MLLSLLRSLGVHSALVVDGIHVVGDSCYRRSSHWVKR